MDNSYFLNQSSTQLRLALSQDIPLLRNGTLVNVASFGADPTNTADSSAAFISALNSGASFIYAGSGEYIVHDVAIPNGVTLFAYGASFNDAAGADHVFKLTGFASRLMGAYIANAPHCSTAAVIVDQGVFCEIVDTDILNTINGIKLTDSSNGANGYGCELTQLSNIQISTFSGIGFFSGANCHDTFGVNVYVDSGTIAGTGGQVPKLGAIGFVFNGTGSTLAYGGNTLVNCIGIGMQDAVQLINTNLIKLVNFLGDSLCGVAYNISGNTNQCDIQDSFAGTCAVAVQGAATSQSNSITGMRTTAVGVIPGGAGSNYFSQNGYAAPFYELVQQGTATFSIDLDDWRAFGANAHTFSEAVQNNITMTGGIRIPFNTQANVAANSTVYTGATGQNASEGFAETMLPAGAVLSPKRVMIYSSTAPGAGQTYTYTVFANGAATGITGQSSGASAFAPTMGGSNLGGIGIGTSISLQIVTSASAQAGNHRGYMLLMPQPN